MQKGMCENPITRELAKQADIIKRESWKYIQLMHQNLLHGKNIVHLNKLCIMCD